MEQCRSRLIVFDNCEAATLIERWRPATGGSRILITSRRSAWSAALRIETWPLTTLNRQDSMSLLRTYGLSSRVSTALLAAIAAELDDLPLALHLAGSFLAKSASPAAPQTYLAQLRDPPPEQWPSTFATIVQHPSFQVEGETLTGHTQHIIRTFALSYDQLSR